MQLIEPKVSLKVKYTDKNHRKQTVISRLRFGKCLLNNVLGLFERHESGFFDFCGVRKNVKDKDKDKEYLFRNMLH